MPIPGSLNGNELRPPSIGEIIQFSTPPSSPVLACISDVNASMLRFSVSAPGIIASPACTTARPVLPTEPPSSYEGKRKRVPSAFMIMRY